MSDDILTSAYRRRAERAERELADLRLLRAGTAMKIFYWSDIETLAQHASGMVVVFASSKEEAVLLAIADYGADDSRMEPDDKALAKELRSKEPEVFEGSKAFVIDGSA